MNTQGESSVGGGKKPIIEQWPDVIRDLTEAFLSANISA